MSDADNARKTLQGSVDVGVMEEKTATWVVILPFGCGFVDPISVQIMIWLSKIEKCGTILSLGHVSGILAGPLEITGQCAGNGS